MVKPSPSRDVREMYDATADSCAEMMDAEIDLPVYVDVLAVAIAQERLGIRGQMVEGEMSDLSAVESGTATALLNFFAVHHLDPDGVRGALGEWSRVLRSGGQLVVAAWEGTGAIDYGDAAGIVALRYRDAELATWAEEAGFIASRCAVEPVEGFPMDAVYLERAKD